jgi:surfeit locus 1 family protein
MRLREYGLVVLSLAMALLCLRLGVWQVSRLYERRASNAFIAHRLHEPPVSLAQLPRDTAALRFRRVTVHGTYDYAHELVLTTRTRNGSPGVNVLTPVRIAGSDTALLVNRGWVYSPDGVHVDLTRWREGDSAIVLGFAVPPNGRRDGRGAVRSPTRRNAYRWLDFTAISATVPYPVYPFVVVLEDGSTPSPTRLPRIAPPPLDEGPHLSYAIQWFSFATIAVVGMVVFIRRVRRREPDPLTEV